MPIEADLVLLSFDIVPCRFCIFYKLKVCGHPVSSNSIGSHYFSNSICSHHVSESHFCNSWNISNFYTIILFVMVICDHRSLMLLLLLFGGAKLKFKSILKFQYSFRLFPRYFCTFYLCLL